MTARHFPALGWGFYCTASEIGYLWYTEGHGVVDRPEEGPLHYSFFPTYWPFTGTHYEKYWSSQKGKPMEPGPGSNNSPVTRLAFDINNGEQVYTWEFKEAYVWPMTDGDPLALPAVQILNPALDFGSHDLSTTAPAMSSTIVNSGLAPLTIQSLDNSSPTEFPLQTETCTGTTLNPGQTCEATWKFTPAADGGRSATIQIVSDADSSPDSIALSGTGVGVRTLTVSPSQLDNFGPVLVNTESRDEKTITVRNDGTTDIVIDLVFSDNDQFVITGNTCSGHILSPSDQTLPTQGNRNGCIISVKFHPTKTGATTGRIRISTDTFGHVVSVLGTGVDATFSVSPSAVDFGGQAILTDSALRTITITNTGVIDLVLGSQVGFKSRLFARSDSDDFEIAGTHCHYLYHLRPGKSCTFDLLFHPQAKGPRSGKIHFATNRQSPHPKLLLSELGEEVALERLVPDDLHFGEQPVDTSSASRLVNLLNQGSAAIQVASVIPDSAEFEIGTDTCTGQTIGPAKVCAFEVLFKPTGAGARTGHVVVSSDAPSAPDTVAVAGTGTVPEPLHRRHPLQTAYRPAWRRNRGRAR